MLRRSLAQIATLIQNKQLKKKRRKFLKNVDKNQIENEN